MVVDKRHISKKLGQLADGLVLGRHDVSDWKTLRKSSSGKLRKSFGKCTTNEKKVLDCTRKLLRTYFSTLEASSEIGFLQPVRI